MNLPGTILGAAAAPFFREFDLAAHGVHLVHPEVNYAHPLDGGRAAVGYRSLAQTAAGLGAMLGEGDMEGGAANRPATLASYEG